MPTVSNITVQVNTQEIIGEIEKLLVKYVREHFNGVNYNPDWGLRTAEVGGQHILTGIGAGLNTSQPFLNKDDVVYINNSYVASTTSDCLVLTSSEDHRWTLYKYGHCEIRDDEGVLRASFTSFED